VTVTDLIKLSLRLIRAYGPGETPTATELSDGLVILNEMIDAMNAERCYVISVNRVAPKSLTANKGDYTIGGLTADFTDTRPIKIEAAGLILDSSVSNPIEVPLEVLINHDEWAAIYLKSLVATYPRKLYYEPDFPLGVIHLWPVPTSNLIQLVLYMWQVISAFTTVSDTVSFPPGYQTFMRTQLAIWLAEEYGITPTENVVTQAKEAKERVKDTNIDKEVPILTTAYPVSERGRFNIVLGDWKQ
jgi:hypothetical protein